MKILFLGYTDSPLIKFLQQEGEEVMQTEDKIQPSFITDNKIDYIISYGYRHLIKKEILDLLPGRVINLHIAYLPFNRGADPNFWSIMEDTPKGVTIHHVDEGLDTGDIILQEELSFSGNETLRSTYQRLRDALDQLFIMNWKHIKKGAIAAKKQEGAGSFHRSKDKISLVEKVENWLDMPISMLREKIKT